MNRSAYQLILAAITLLISTTAHGAGVYLKVNGYDDTTGQTTILVTNGFDAYVGSVVAHTHDSHEERDQIDTDPDTGEPIYGDWYTVWDEPIYTIYHASVPGEWLGLGFSFSSDGTGWTPFLPFVEDDETHEITAFDWNGLGQRATPSPNFNVTTQGNRINLGRWWGDASRPVFTLKSWDNDNMYWPCVGMDFTAH